MGYTVSCRISYSYLFRGGGGGVGETTVYGERDV